MTHMTKLPILSIKKEIAADIDLTRSNRWKGYILNSMIYCHSHKEFQVTCWIMKWCMTAAKGTAVDWVNMVNIGLCAKIKIENYDRKVRHSLLKKLNFSSCYCHQLRIHFLSDFLKYLNSWDGAWFALIDYSLGRQIVYSLLWSSPILFPPPPKTHSASFPLPPPLPLPPTPPISLLDSSFFFTYLPASFYRFASTTSPPLSHPL